MSKTSGMSGHQNGNGSAVLRLTRNEILEQLERGARARRGVSARTLLRQHGRNRLQDPGAVADLLALSYLLEKSDPIFAQS